MARAFKVVTDVSEIAKLNKKLASHLRKTFYRKELREITYPAGHFTGSIYFEDASGKSVRAWSPKNELTKLRNYLLYGEPGTSKWIEISVQLNFPAETYNRRMAGAFLVDAQGDVFIAHRGKLAKGNSGLRKRDVFREFASRLVEADDGPQASTLILIASLDDPDLADRLFEFAVEAREVATKLGAEKGEIVKADKTNDGSNKKEVALGRKGPPRADAGSRMLKLRKYFDEYAGEGRTKGHGGGKRTVEHGDIVKSLATFLIETGEGQKAQAIDLAVVSQERVDLFEVKTSAGTTDVYTGVGQLLIHGECISDLLGLPVHRYLVLPDRPNKVHESHIIRKGDMRIVTFQKINGGYDFNGI